jgi:hypothetical protein
MKGGLHIVPPYQFDSILAKNNLEKKTKKKRGWICRLISGMKKKHPK